MTILFVSLSWHPFLLRCGFSLPILHGMHLMAPTQLCPFGWCVIPAGHFSQKCLSRNLKIGFLLSPPPNHALLPLTHDLTASCIGWVQAGEVWALRVPSICVQNLSAAHSSVVVWRLACTVWCPFFDLLCELLFDFLLPLRVGPLLLLGFTFLSAHFLIALISYHVTLLFML